MLVFSGQSDLTETILPQHDQSPTVIRMAIRSLHPCSNAQQRTWNMNCLAFMMFVINVYLFCLPIAGAKTGICLG